jgi:hypothetical protein
MTHLPLIAGSEAPRCAVPCAVTSIEPPSLLVRRSVLAFCADRRSADGARDRQIGIGAESLLGGLVPVSSPRGRSGSVGQHHPEAGLAGGHALVADVGIGERQRLVEGVDAGELGEPQCLLGVREWRTGTRAEVASAPAS